MTSVVVTYVRMVDTGGWPTIDQAVGSSHDLLEALEALAQGLAVKRTLPYSTIPSGKQSQQHRDLNMRVWYSSEPAVVGL